MTADPARLLIPEKSMTIRNITIGYKLKLSYDQYGHYHVEVILWPVSSLLYKLLELHILISNKIILINNCKESNNDVYEEREGVGCM